MTATPVPHRAVPRDIVYLDGRYVERAAAMVHVEDRGYQFSDGVYEVVRFHGRRGIRLRAHLERMKASEAGLRIVGAPTPDEWMAILDRLMDECGLPDDESNVTILYQQVTRGASPRNHLFPHGGAPVKPVATANFRPAPAYTADQRGKGIALSTQPDDRWNRCHIKSVSLLPVVMAKQAAYEAGAFEALFVRDDGTVTEGGATNAYCVIGGAIHTHPTGNRILGGIARAMALEAAAAAGIPVIERPVPVAEFRAADEAFITSTTMDVMPATRLDGQPIGNETVGPVTTRLAAAMAELVESELRAR